ncbi:hypothetical protein ACLKA6_018424, partial [Drosophila palustris]
QFGFNWISQLEVGQILPSTSKQILTLVI